MCDINFEGIIYPSTEHAYQASKFPEKEIREEIAKLPKPFQTKKVAEMATLSDDWHTSIKFEIMEIILLEKFKIPELRQLLLDTKEEDLIEGNTWHDNCWGTCTCNKCGNKGENHLGRLLMKIREKITNDTK